MQTQPVAFQLTQIENGWLFQLPERPSPIQNGGRIPPTVKFCSDYDAVCACIKEVWPSEIVGPK